MAWRYSLSKLFPQGQTFRVSHQSGDIVKSTLVRFEPDKVYETEDSTLVRSLQKLNGRYPKTQSNLNWFNEIGVPFTEVPCSSCGGRVMKYEVPYFNIEEV